MRRALLVLLVLACAAGGARAQVPGASGRIAFAYADDPDSFWRISSVNPDGSDVQALTSGSGHRDRQPAWAPYGSSVAFMREGAIDVVESDGAVSSKTDGPEDREPAWSRGGTIAFTRSTDSGTDIWVVPADRSSDPHALIAGPGDERTPAWSPDGTRIAYSVDGALWIADADGANTRKLVDDGDQPSWSPDGTRIAFTWRAAPCRDDDGCTNIVVVDASDGGNRVDVSATVPEDENPDLWRTWDSHADWSPDGAQLVFARSGDNCNCRKAIWIADADGANPHKIVGPDDFGNGEYDWPSWQSVRTNSAPVAAFIFSPSSPSASEPVTFTNDSSDADGDGLTYAWDFGDGSTSTDTSPQHAYLAPGTYTVRLTSTDPSSASSTVTHDVVVRAPNTPPVASFDVQPPSGTTATAFTFASTSTDADGDGLTYAWAFDDGATATGATATHRFAREGSHVVTLTVDDGRGGHASTARAIEVAPTTAPSPAPPAPTPTTPNAGDSPPPGPNHAPEFTIAAPGAPAAGVSLTFTATGGDPDGDDVTLHWEFSDGGHADGQRVEHTYSGPGTYDVVLRATDSRGETTSDTRTLNVAAGDLALLVNVRSSITVGQAFSAAVNVIAAFGSPPYHYEWHWGDGAVSEGRTVTHTYSKAGIKTIAVEVTDAQGNIGHTTRTVLAVTGPAPSISYSPFLPAATVATQFHGSATHAPGTAGQIVKWSWSFGPGRSAVGRDPTVVFPSAGSYTVTLTVTDASHRTGTATVTVIVALAPPIVISIDEIVAAAENAQ